jgi:hypothetical protein
MWVVTRRGRRVVSAEEALSGLTRRGGLENVEILGTLRLSDEWLWRNGREAGDLSFVNCRIEALSIQVASLSRRMVLKDCPMGLLELVSVGFMKGLEIRDCSFSQPALLSASTLCRPGHGFAMTGCRFSQRLRVWNCFLDGPVEVAECSFDRGTNFPGLPAARLPGMPLGLPATA